MTGATKITARQPRIAEDLPELLAHQPRAPVSALVRSHASSFRNTRTASHEAGDAEGDHQEPLTPEHLRAHALEEDPARHHQEVPRRHEVGEPLAARAA